MRASFGSSSRIQLHQAVQEAVEQALRPLPSRGADALLVLATAAWGAEALGAVAEEAVHASGCPLLAGASVTGLLAGEEWVAHRPALAVLAFSGTGAEVFERSHLPGDEARLGAEWRGNVSGAPRAGDLLVVFVDGLAASPDPLLAGLAEAFPGTGLLGLGASEPEGGGGLVFAGEAVFEEGASALLLRGVAPPTLSVTHACREVGDRFGVTRSRGHWVHGLEGRPALDVLRDLERRYPEPPGEPRLVGLYPGGGPVAEPAGAAPLIRSVVGIDEAQGSFALPEAVAVGTTLVGLLRDPDRRWEGRAPGEVAAGLHFTCPAAGPPQLEFAMGAGGLAAPVLGASAAYPIGPLPQECTAGGFGVPRLHPHAAVSALLSS